ncbi:MAG TPA: hypothetical protein PLC25_05605 [Bacilli bacterium]|nr:hypothetical protein [Bacilli bacterium]
MKSYKQFINESIINIYFPLSWKELDPKKEGISADQMYKRPLSKKGFYCMVLVRSDGKTHTFYIEDDMGTYTFMDYVGEKSIALDINKIITLQEAYELCERQLDYYNKMEKLPTEEEIKEFFYIFSDENIDTTNYDIKYGYESGRISDENNYEMVLYHRPRFNSNFICVLSFNDDEFDFTNIESMIHEFKVNIEDIKNTDYKIQYFKDTRGLLIVIS